VRRTLAIALWLTMGAACVTPVIPLPPPNIREMGLTVTDPVNHLITVSGPTLDSSQPTAHYVFIVNESNGRGVITLSKDDGSFTTDPFEARDGDTLRLWAAHAPQSKASELTCGIVSYATGKLDECQP
jgi:hypothetical protein